MSVSVPAEVWEKLLARLDELERLQKEVLARLQRVDERMVSLVAAHELQKTELQVNPMFAGPKEPAADADGVSDTDGASSTVSLGSLSELSDPEDGTTYL